MTVKQSGFKLTLTERHIRNSIMECVRRIFQRPGTRNLCVIRVLTGFQFLEPFLYSTVMSPVRCLWDLTLSRALQSVICVHCIFSLGHRLWRQSNETKCSKSLLEFQQNNYHTSFLRKCFSCFPFHVKVKWVPSLPGFWFRSPYMYYDIWVSNHWPGSSWPKLALLSISVSPPTAKVRLFPFPATRELEYFVFAARLSPVYRQSVQVQLEVVKVPVVATLNFISLPWLRVGSYLFSKFILLLPQSRAHEGGP
jgi:hypothetical protein